MDITGEIIIHQSISPLTRRPEHISYQWHGGMIAYIPMELLPEYASLGVPLKNGSVFRIGPFRLRVIDTDWVGHRIICMRANLLAGYLYYIWHRSTRIIDLIYRRLIITAAVWNIAYFNNASVPSWRDLYIAHGINRMLHK